LFAHGRWFTLDTPVSSTTKTGRHDIAKILLKVALNTINQSINHLYLRIWSEIEIYVILTCKSGSFWSSRKYSTSSGVCAVTENNLCLKKSNYVKAWFRLMVFNATFNNISAISWRSVLLLKETGVPGENHRPAASHWKLYHIIVYRVHPA
jgi:hypothetical protein